MKLLLAFCLPLLAFSQTLRILPAARELRGSNATQQFLVLSKGPDGMERDVTSEVAWRISNPQLARWSGPARLSALGDGTLQLTATLGKAQAATTVKLRDTRHTRPITFSRDVEAIFTKRGCNGSVCHGGVKGRGGFKLSANALHPKDDYDWIVKGGGYQVLTTEVKGDRIPRIDRGAPEKSLLLTKPLMTVPHGGGKRLEPDSEDYRTLLEWIRAGAAYGGDQGATPQLTRLEITPALAVLPLASTHRLLVTAHFADGHTEDFTHQVLYSSNNGDVATVSADGVITAKEKGETAIMIRAAGQLASAVAGVVGAPVINYPAVARHNFIDEFVFDKLRRFQIIPSDLSSDAEFLRRICLDLTGTLPPPQRVREFLASRDPKKREKVIDALIGSPEFVDYWTYRFADVFRVSIFTNALSSKMSQDYWEWIRNNIEQNRPYNLVAQERISAQGYHPASRHFLPYSQVGPPGEVMGEEVRVFFGRRLDCAQCHNHPYENWSQDQFWGMAAFFSRIFKLGSVVMDHPTNMDLSSKDVDAKIELLHPRTKAEVKPALLEPAPLALSPDGNPRKVLAQWMTQHPYFAEATVNRIWGMLFARGIVEPVDDFRSTNPPTHPELLAALAKDFQSHGYDLRHLMKTIAMSRTYQLSAKANATNRGDLVNYSRSMPRGLEADTLLDAVSDVTGVPETFSTAITDGATVGQAPLGTRAVQLRDPDTFFSRFLELYGRANRGAVPERNTKPNLAQALHMLAGDSYTQRITSPEGRLAKLLAAGATDQQIIEEFYLAAYTRLPEAQELADLKALVARRPDRPAAFRELVWALLSSREFAENH